MGTRQRPRRDHHRRCHRHSRSHRDRPAWAAANGCSPRYALPGCDPDGCRDDGRAGTGAAAPRSEAATAPPGWCHGAHHLHPDGEQHPGPYHPGTDDDTPDNDNETHNDDNDTHNDNNDDDETHNDETHNDNDAPVVRGCGPPVIRTARSHSTRKLRASA